MTEDATTRRTRSDTGARVVLGVAMDRIKADRAKLQTFLRAVERVFGTEFFGRNTHAQR